MATKLRIKLVKSIIGQTKNNKRVVESLGLRKTGRIVVQSDTPDIRGKIHKVKHMLQVESFEEEAGAEATPKKVAAKKPVAEVAPVKAKAEKKSEPAEETPAETPKPKKPRAKAEKTEE